MTMLGNHKKTTGELLSDIKSIAKKQSDGEFNYYVQKSQKEFSYNPVVGQYIRDILGDRIKDVKIKELADLTGISQSYLYQIIPVKEKPPKTIKSRPDRRILIAIAIYLGFSVDETQHLLKYANERELYPRNVFDTVILYSLERNCSIVKTNILLNDNHCEILDWHKERSIKTEDEDLI